MPGDEDEAGARTTVVVPVHDGATTLDEVLDSLACQDGGLVEEAVLLDDGSTDCSLGSLKAFAERAPFPCRVLSHETPWGLAATLNEGIALANTPSVVTLHQDVVLPRRDALSTLLGALDPPGVAAAYPVVDHPLEVWRSYGFWQKCLFSRQVGRPRAVLTGKFDAFDRQAVLDVGLFDAETYRTAGEDGELVQRLRDAGKELRAAPVRVVHVHDRSASFGLRRWASKEAQIAEAMGVLLRRHGPWTPARFTAATFRQLLAVSLLVPPLHRGARIVVGAYAFAYTGRVYRECWRDPRVLALPAVNVGLLYVSLAGMVRGFVTGRQRL